MKRLFYILIGLFISFSAYAANTQQAIDSLQASLKTAKNDSTKAAILREIGVIYVDKGNYPKAIEVFLKSKDLFQSIKNEYGVFRCENILGVTYSYMGDQKTALNYLLKCKKGIDNGILYDNLGLIYYNANYTGNSLIYWKLALDFYKQKSDTVLIARLLNDIGSLYELQGKTDTAIAYYNECLQTSTDGMNLSGAYASLGDIYFKQGKYKIALEYENKSLKIAKEIGNLVSARETEKMLSDIYWKMGDCKASLIHYTNYVSIKDSLINEDNIKQIVRVEENSKFDKEKEIAKVEQDKKDAVQAEQLKSQKFQKNVFIGIASMVALFLMVLFLVLKRVVQEKKKVVKANAIIEQQKQKIEHEKKEITDNITYAQRIQRALLPSEGYINNLADNFLIYKPKDIVSGDFYWCYSDNEGNYFATADCTGHGVSGAMMSMLASSLLNEIVIERGIKRPDLILNALRDEIIKALNKEGAYEERKDGLDISLCKINRNGWLENAAANNSVYIIRNGTLIERKADRFPVGKYINESPFTLNETELQKGDIIYTFSDGFADQFGGENGKKLMSKKFKEWLIELSPLEMPQIKFELEARFTQWIGKGEQIDDVTIFAVKI